MILMAQTRVLTVETAEILAAQTRRLKMQATSCSPRVGRLAAQTVHTPWCLTASTVSSTRKANASSQPGAWLCVKTAWVTLKAASKQCLALA